MGFPKQEYWSGLPFPSPGDLPDTGIELTSPAVQADSLLPQYRKVHKSTTSCRMHAYDNVHQTGKVTYLIGYANTCLHL